MVQKLGMRLNSAQLKLARLGLSLAKVVLNSLKFTFFFAGILSLVILFCINIFKINILTALCILVFNTVFIFIWIFINSIRKSIKNEDWDQERDEEFEKGSETMDHLEQLQICET